MKVDPEFLKYLGKLQALPESKKEEIRQHLYKEAGLDRRSGGLRVLGNPKGLREPGNIDLSNRPVVQNPDGTVSTEKSFSKATDKGEVLVPQVVNGKMMPSQDEAWKHYEQTGEHMGIFDTPENANAYAEAVHNRGSSTPSSQGQ